MAPAQAAKTEHETGLVLGLSLIAILVILLFAALFSGFKPGPMEPGLNTTMLGLYIFAWGAMFLASYFFEHKTFFFRGLIWVCEHFSHPKGREMAFFYAALAMGMGGFAILRGIDVV